MENTLRNYGPAFGNFTREGQTLSKDMDTDVDGVQITGVEDQMF